ncbi:MAG: GcrA family cell cycle regulator [Alphaproteobacteria bacterium]
MPSKPPPAAEIYRLYDEEGKSYDEIAALFPGLSRNGVSGLIYRYRQKHKLAPKRPDKRSAKTPGEERRWRKKKNNPFAEPLKLSVIRFKPTHTLGSFLEVLEQNSCRYIEGDPKIKEGEDAAVFCGHPRANTVKGQSSYCAGHLQGIYVPPPRPRKDGKKFELEPMNSRSLKGSECGHRAQELRCTTS